MRVHLLLAALDVLAPIWITTTIAFIVPLNVEITVTNSVRLSCILAPIFLALLLVCWTLAHVTIAGPSRAFDSILFG